jgi:hypothetical protein
MRAPVQIDFERMTKHKTREREKGKFNLFPMLQKGTLLTSKSTCERNTVCIADERDIAEYDERKEKGAMPHRARASTMSVKRQ